MANTMAVDSTVRAERLDAVVLVWVVLEIYYGSREESAPVVRGNGSGANQLGFEAVEFGVGIRRSSGGRWSSWSDPGEHPKSCRASSSRPRDPSRTGSIKLIAMPAGAVTARPLPSARN